MPRGRSRSKANSASRKSGSSKNEPRKRGRDDAEEESEPRTAVQDETVSSVNDNRNPDAKRKKLETKKNVTADDVANNGEANQKDSSKSKASKPLMNKSSTNYDEIDFGCDKQNAAGKPWNFKISSWNVDGLRAWLNKGGLQYLNYEKPDILCLQETKCSKEKLPKEIVEMSDYRQYWACGEKEGYAGVGILSKEEPQSVVYGLSKEFDSEGRIITAEYNKYYLICTYVPNSGRGLVTLPKRLEWNKAFREHVKNLDSKKPVIICGDMNVSHLEIDLTNPKTNKKNAGFTQEERDGMTEFLEDGYVDTFRKLYPDKTGSYTFWTYMSNCRAKNVGWRLDYAIVSERFMTSVCDNIIRSDVFGSDHCPITLFLHLD